MAAVPPLRLTVNVAGPTVGCGGTSRVVTSTPDVSSAAGWRVQAPGIDAASSSAGGDGG